MTDGQWARQVNDAEAWVSGFFYSHCKSRLVEAESVGPYEVVTPPNLSSASPRKHHGDVHPPLQIPNMPLTARGTGENFRKGPFLGASNERSRSSEPRSLSLTDITQGLRKTSGANSPASSRTAAPGSPTARTGEHLSGARSFQGLETYVGGCAVSNSSPRLERANSGNVHVDSTPQQSQFGSPRNPALQTVVMPALRASRASSPRAVALVGRRVSSGCPSRHTLGSLPSASSVQFVSHSGVTKNMRYPSPPPSVASVRMSAGASVVRSSASSSIDGSSPRMIMAGGAARNVGAQSPVHPNSPPAASVGSAKLAPVKRSSSGSSLPRGGLYPNGASTGRR